MLAHLAPAAATLHATLLAAKTTSTTAAPKSSGSSTIVLFLVVILGIGYFAFMRPRQKQRLAAQQAAQQRPLDVGDEVATSAGIIGRVRRIEDDRVQLEIAPGMTIQVLRQNLGRPLATASDISLGPIGPGSGDDSWHGAGDLDSDDGDAPATNGVSGNGSSKGASNRFARAGRKPAGADSGESADGEPGWSLASDDVHHGEDDAAPAGGSAG